MLELNNPIVTIGMCVKNGELYIKDAINSILDQNYPNNFLEIIFVDDGSTDRTLSIIKKFVTQTKIKTKIFHGPWRGLGASRNTIVKNAEGKYIIWVDMDVILTNNYVKKIVQSIKNKKNIGIVAGQYTIHPDSNLLFTLEGISFILPRSQKSWDEEPARFLPGTAGSLYLVEAIKQVGGFDETVTGAGEDQIAAKKIIDAGWKISRSKAVFYESPNKIQNFKDFWSRHSWYGSCFHSLYIQNKMYVKIYKMTPPVGMIAGLFRSIKGYRLIGRKIIFLFPLHFALRHTAWCFGFIKSQILTKFTRMRARISHK